MANNTGLIVGGVVLSAVVIVGLVLLTSRPKTNTPPYVNTGTGLPSNINPATGKPYTKKELNELAVLNTMQQQQNDPNKGKGWVVVGGVLQLVNTAANIYSQNQAAKTKDNADGGTEQREVEFV